LLAYLNVGTMDQLSEPKQEQSNQVRVVDRPDVQEMLPFFSEAS